MPVLAVATPIATRTTTLPIDIASVVGVAVACDGSVLFLLSAVVAVAAVTVSQTMDQ